MTGHRGAAGELTVRVAAGDATLWQGVDVVWLSDTATSRCYEVEAARAYRDRLVLKLAGVNDASVAAALRGRTVSVERDAAPPLPEGAYHAALLIGAAVTDESGRALGIVEDIVETGGVDLLRVLSDGRDETEILIPMAPEILRTVDLPQSRIVVRLPDGLEELN